MTWTYHWIPLHCIAGPRIKALKQKAVDVVLSFTTNGIRVADGAELIQSEAFDNVVYAGQDATDKKRFAYMTHYTRLGIIFCHVFSMKKGAETETVASSINALMLARGKPPVDKFAAHEKTTGQTLGIFELGFVGEVGLRHFKETVAMTTAEEAMLKKQLADAVRYVVDATVNKKIQTNILITKKKECNMNLPTHTVSPEGSAPGYGTPSAPSRIGSQPATPWHVC